MSEENNSHHHFPPSLRFYSKQYRQGSSTTCLNQERASSSSSSLESGLSSSASCSDASYNAVLKKKKTSSADGINPYVEREQHKLSHGANPPVARSIGDDLMESTDRKDLHKATFNSPERYETRQNSSNNQLLSNYKTASSLNQEKMSSSHVKSAPRSQINENHDVPMDPLKNNVQTGCKETKTDLRDKITSDFTKKTKISHTTGLGRKENEIQICTLYVWLQIRKCLENDSLPEFFRTRLDGFNVELSYESSRILFRLKMTECKFAITGDEVAVKESLTTLVSHLEVELKKKVKYSFWKKFASAAQKGRKSSTTKVSLKPNSDDSDSIKDAKDHSEQNSSSLLQTEKINTNEEQANLKCEIKKAMNSIDDMSKKIIKNHEKEMDKIQCKIDDSSLREDDLYGVSEKEAEAQKVLSQKLEELKKQKAEFIERCQELCNDLRSFDILKATSSNIKSVCKSVSVECSRLRNALPIYARRKDIINQVKSHQVSVILGETGSGKSTQLVQYLYEAGIADYGSIVCTQPRRIAAVTLAERVANEMLESVGDLVGYKAGTVNRIKQKTKIIFTTDHSLLSECLKDRDLKKYSCIIIDEAHERSIYTDILLGIIKSCLQRRPDLKVIITSATIDPEVFIRYFSSGPELRVSGRTYPVDLFYAEDGSDDFENYEEKAVSKAVEIHISEAPGDILVFLSSPVEIMRCCEEFEKRCTGKGKTNFKCFPLHGQLPSEEQKKVFEKLPEDKRKVVFATNCAETSITIDGIMYVIDTGVAKEMKYDSKRSMNQLGIHAISKSSANQRKGRAGRTASGKCYRLYSKDSFEALESINDPEILRVHLGQAVLKLFELGVDVKSYDFVQAPSEIALNSAMETLEFLGAIVENQITDKGRWISKLSFDPKLGYLIHEAERENLLYDAVVLASVVSSGSDLFFRGFTESEAQVVAKSKIDFGSEFGDVFTWLQVFKAWSSVSDEEKSSWCRNHCVSYKSITFVRQSIKDTKVILSKDLGINMISQFSTEVDAMDRLRKILFNAYAASISNFSQLSRAGYFSLVPECQVHIHPSSILAALNMYPEWIVYTNLIRTSREFIKGITVVEDEWVRELVASDKLKLDITKAEQNKFYIVHREEVGPTIFRDLVGPRFSNLGTIEEELLNSGLLQTVIEASRDLGVIDVHSPFSMNQSARNVFESIKSITTEKLLSDDFEFPLNRKESIVSSGTRVVIGRGGCVKNVFMPEQSDKVMIRRIHGTVTEEDIVKKFETFGEIKEVVPFKSYDPWGFIRFCCLAEALSAVEATKTDKCLAGSLKLDKYAKHGKNMFEAKVTWIRRPIKGSGTAFIKCPELLRSLLIGRSLMLNGRYCEIKLSNRGDDLIVFKTGSADENEVKDQVVNLIRNDDFDTTDIGVTISRERVEETIEDMNSKVNKMTSFIKRYLDEDSFKVNMLRPKGGSVYYVCYLNFTDPVRGYHVCQQMKHQLCIDAVPVEVQPCLKTTVQVPQKLKAVYEERFKTLFVDFARYKATKLTWKDLKKDSAIEIQSSMPSNIVDARDVLCKELEGEILDCSLNDTVGCLLNKSGQNCLKKIEKDNGCVIITDFRSGKIHIHGTESKTSKTQQDINSYLNEVEGSAQSFIEMRGDDKPPGLMKLAMQKYGALLNGLVEDFKLRAVNVNWKKHAVHLVGTSSAIEKACQSLTDLETEAWRSCGKTKEANLPDCQVCMCPIEEKDLLFRLEVCGHAYCLDCLKHQLSFSVNNKEFPLTCAGGGCDSSFVMKDIRFALSRKWIQEDKLVSMAMNAFVMANKDKYKFCITPNCPVVYKVTNDQNGCEFNCPLCFASICTTCHLAFHAGMTCLMAKSGSEANSVLQAWVALDPKKRKLCPGCHSPIEKIAGCNKMRCTSCQTYFCWLCLCVSPTEDDCYRHLQKVHGGFS